VAKKLVKPVASVVNHVLRTLFQTANHVKTLWRFLKQGNVVIVALSFNASQENVQQYQQLIVMGFVTRFIIKLISVDVRHHFANLWFVEKTFLKIVLVVKQNKSEQISVGVLKENVSEQYAKFIQLLLVISALIMFKRMINVIVQSHLNVQEMYALQKLQ